MNLKHLIRNHITSLLIAITLIFLFLIIVAYVWGIGYIVTAANDAANKSAATGASSSFDLQDAAKLNYRGTLQQ